VTLIEVGNLLGYSMLTVALIIAIYCAVDLLGAWFERKIDEDDDEPEDYLR